AEAGTGTGKTFAYLVPALLAGGRVIISTGTKTLQDQLFHRDLPQVRAAGEGATFGSRDEISHLQKIRSFAARSMSGDRGECADVPETSPAWMRATSTRENCLGSACRHYQDCFV